MRIGLTELLIIVVIAIAVLRPEKLPEYAKKFSLFMERLKESTKAINEVTEPVREAVKPVTELKNEITDQVEQLKNNMTSTMFLLNMKGVSVWFGSEQQRLRK